MAQVWEANVSGGRPLGSLPYLEPIAREAGPALGRPNNAHSRAGESVNIL